MIQKIKGIFLKHSPFLGILLVGLNTSCTSVKKAENKASSSLAISQPLEKKTASHRPVASFNASHIHIMLDPGHGAQDRGCQSNYGSKIKEKMLSLQTAWRVQKFLEKLGFQVEMTRKKDIFISLDQRVEMAEHFQSHVFVSLHYNFALNSQAHGVEVFYYPDKNNSKRLMQSKKLAEFILKKISVVTSAHSRGIKPGNFAVIRNTSMPAILIEGGFLSNLKEATALSSPAYVNKLAWCIAKGIEEFVRYDYQRNSD